MIDDTLSGGKKFQGSGSTGKAKFQYMKQQSSLKPQKQKKPTNQETKNAYQMSIVSTTQNNQVATPDRNLNRKQSFTQ